MSSREVSCEHITQCPECHKFHCLKCKCYCETVVPNKCYFCGTPVLYDEDNFRIRCNRCDARGPASTGRRGAVERWNSFSIGEVLSEQLKKFPSQEIAEKCPACGNDSVYKVVIQEYPFPLKKICNICGDIQQEKQS